MLYRAICFDLDGTLLDTLDDLADSMNAALGGQGLPTHPVAAYRRFVGDGVRMLAVRALPEDWRDDGTVERTVQLMRAEYSQRWDAKTRPYDGVPELLDELARRGVKLAVLSNKPHDFTKLCVAKLLPAEKFAVVQGVEDGVAPKPDAAGARRVAETLAVPPAKFLYVGDTDTDMQTALAAGMFAVGATWGFRDADELRANGAAALIDHPRELLTLL